MSTHDIVPAQRDAPVQAAVDFNEALATALVQLNENLLSAHERTGQAVQELSAAAIERDERSSEHLAALENRVEALNRQIGAVSTDLRALGAVALAAAEQCTLLAAALATTGPDQGDDQDQDPAEPQQHTSDEHAASR